MRRARAAAHGSAAAMEKADAHAGVATELREFPLRLLQSPLARENARVLVAIAIPDHHLLAQRQPLAPPVPRAEFERAPRHRVFEERTENFGRGLEIAQRFEQGHHGQY